MSVQSPNASSHEVLNPVERHRRISSPQGRSSAYLRSLFPFTSWIGHYNSTWLASDLIAGLTVGAIVVPQGMAYASLAKLDPEFGLYSSFVGVMIYWLFGTSKDISIGPVAVLSTVVGNLVNEVKAANPDVIPYAVAASLSLFSGFIVLLMGLLRCGWLVNLVSAPSLAAFMTGSAITIVASQVPSILGLTGFSTRESPSKVIVNILLSISNSDWNAVLGLSALVLLYLARFVLTKAAESSPKYRSSFQLLNSMRAVSVICLFTLISWIVNRNRVEDPVFDLLGTIPRGFQHFGMPPVDIGLFTSIVSFLPATIVVMLVEHMAIGKSFGRANHYTIGPSQEMLAIGVTNVIGPFFGGYPSTGSFSRTAIQSKAGARTPLAGPVTGMVVLLAVHLLTAVFYYIPSAVLSAVVVHAVGDLITPIITLRQYWSVSPSELIVFLVGVLASVVKSIETGLYASVGLSTAILFFRSVQLQSNDTRLHLALPLVQYWDDRREGHPVTGQYGTFEGSQHDRSGRLDVGHSEVAKAVDFQSPGMISYTFSSSLHHMNSARPMEEILQIVREHTSPSAHTASESSQNGSWASAGKEANGNWGNLSLPPLQTVVLNLRSVQHIDATATQQLVDLKRQLDSYAVPDGLEWRFVDIKSHQVRAALEAASLVEREDINIA